MFPFMFVLTRVLAFAFELAFVLSAVMFVFDVLMLIIVLV